MHILHFPELDSTNNYLLSHLHEYEDEDVVAVADSQTHGRGSGTNSWESEDGKNLTFSILIHPCDISPSRQFIISMAVSIAIRNVIADIIPDGDLCKIKWPNDIYVGDKKICGILIENSLQGGVLRNCVLGIGLNVNQTLFTSDAPNPISLKQITGKEHDRDKILNNILTAFEEVLNGKDFVQECPKIYHSDLYRADGHFYDFCDSGGLFKAKIDHVEESGHIILHDLLGNIRTYAFKEVQFVIG